MVGGKYLWLVHYTGHSNTWGENEKKKKCIYSNNKLGKKRFLLLVLKSRFHVRNDVIRPTLYRCAINSVKKCLSSHH